MRLELYRLQRLFEKLNVVPVTIKGNGKMDSFGHRLGDLNISRTKCFWPVISLAQSLMPLYSPDFFRLSPIIDNGRINVNLGLVLTVGERRVLTGGE